jgi:23S rRNA (guanosine2251-2'-O)-methyltransferase
MLDRSLQNPAPRPRPGSSGGKASEAPAAKTEKMGGRRVVTEALDAGVEIVEIRILQTGRGREWAAIQARAANRGISVLGARREDLDQLLPGVKHQGVVAFYRAPAPIPLETLLHKIADSSARPLLILDGVEDPRNLGAVIRSAEALGAGGVIFRSRRGAGLTPAALKSSAGGAFRLPICAVTNLDQAIRHLKDCNWWIFGLDPGGNVPIWSLHFEGQTAFVLGGEGKGLSRLIRERCDHLVRVPLTGKVASLNVAVCAGVILAEWQRQNAPDSGSFDSGNKSA